MDAKLTLDWTDAQNANAHFFLVDGGDGCAWLAVEPTPSGSPVDQRLAAEEALARAVRNLRTTATTVRATASVRGKEIATTDFTLVDGQWILD